MKSLNQSLNELAAARDELIDCFVPYIKKAVEFLTDLLKTLNNKLGGDHDYN